MNQKRVCDQEELRRRALIAADTALIEELFTCFKDDLLGFMHQRCGNRTDAEDAIQDTFVAAARYLESFRGESQLKTWLYRLASSACTRMRRGQKNKSSIHLDLDNLSQDQMPAAKSQLDAQVEARLRPIQQAIENLNPMDRSVLLLRDGEGLSTREVATALDITESAVKSRLHRTRKSVLQSIEASGRP